MGFKTVEVDIDLNDFSGPDEILTEAIGRGLMPQFPAEEFLR